MCLAAFAFGVSTRYPLVFAANRDEYHERPSAAADWWHDLGILGGRDLRAGGSWLAVDQRGRLAAVTNVYHEREKGAAYPRSRGHLVSDFLGGTTSAEHFATRLRQDGDAYAPFNLLLFDGAEFHYCSNRAPGRRLEPGIYALSNAQLDARWPKVRRAREGMTACLASDDVAGCLFELLAEPSAHPADESAAPSEDRRAALFITDPQHGTRSSAVIVHSAHREVSFAERRFDSRGLLNGESVHRFKAGPSR